MDVGWTPSGERPAVRRIVQAMHRDGRQCWQCQPDGTCTLHAWAIRRTIQKALAIAARRILADHWPADVDTLCPVCKTPDCPPLRTACDYLDLIGDPYVPPRARPMSAIPGAAAAIAVRAADAAMSAAELRAIADQAARADS